MRTFRPAAAWSAVLLGLSLLAAAPLAQAAKSNLPKSSVTYHPDVRFTFRTNIGPKGMTFVGVGNGIDGVDNPTLQVDEGAVVQITLIDGDGAEHNIAVPDFGASSDHVVAKDASTVIVFRADKSGTFEYYCELPGHRQAGMVGKLVVGTAAAPQVEATDITLDPAAVPAPIGKRDPQKVRVDLTTVEVRGRLADGTTYNFWTFNGKVPGPMLRVREGDTVELHLKNEASSRMIHSVDLHAVLGPGGGAAVLQVPPGQEKSITFKAALPGLYVYHCATPMVANHIANGMYGMILVEPAAGLPKVDHEFYVMQGEIYTTGAFGKHGDQEFDVQKLLDEKPEYFVLNGAVGALTKYHPLHSKVGDTVRIYFGVGGPNFTSSFHVIGEIFDHVYNMASLVSPPTDDVQTVSVPPGGATVVDFRTQVPGRYMLVDHALSRMERGLMGFLMVDGQDNPDLYHTDYQPDPHSGH
ncbi:MAG TPA: copper-containing nitrite reductase [Gammaproteobacteria bacterium]|jgi:nitrite reductase (NO-forming)|nr:copper-containing nitrite reductase [Gammaproteobacteria bacterium]